jgi:GNAT superfamily N-acetyltransferase
LYSNIHWKIDFVELFKMNIVKQCTSSDLDEIFDWLEAEYDEDGEGFWSNRDMMEPENMWVIREDGIAVAFQLGKYSAVILNVRKDRCKCGLGSAMVAASIERAVKDGVNALMIECVPTETWSFWQKKGFV